MSHYQEPKLHFFNASGARIAFFEWGDEGGEPLLLIHATGFHARLWDQVVANLKPGYRVIAVDVRGHGRSEKKGPMRDWAEPAQDIIELLRHLKLKPGVGAGHSMGGHVLVQVAAALPGQFTRLLLIDPVMMSPQVMASFPSWPDGVDHPVARRRNSWASWQEMMELFRHRKPYALWDSCVLSDYCQYGTQAKVDGTGVELACPPEIEASIYKAAAGRNIYALTPLIKVPVTILRAKQREPGPRDHTDFSASPTWEELADQFERGRDVFLPELTHFIPMQDPKLVAAFIDGG